jgi:hypothetical protein
MTSAEHTQLHAYTGVSFADGIYFKACTLPAEATRDTAPDLDTILREQLFHALIDRFDIPGVQPLDFTRSSYAVRPSDPDMRSFILAHTAANGVGLQRLKKPLRASDVLTIGHATAKTLMTIKHGIESNLPGVRFRGHNDLKPEHIFVNGRITLIDWQTYELTPVVPPLHMRLCTVEYGSFEHIARTPGGGLSRDTTSMAKILLRSLIGEDAFPIMSDSLQRMTKTRNHQSMGEESAETLITAAETATHPVSRPTSISALLEGHSQQCLYIINKLLHGESVPENEFYQSSALQPADIDAAPELLLLIDEIIRRDLTAYQSPGGQPRMELEEFITRMEELVPVSADSQAHITVPVPFVPVPAPSTTG